MKRSAPCDPYTDGKLLGIMLAGVLSNTRPECGPQAKLRTELRPSGVLQIVRPGEPGSQPASSIDETTRDR